MDHYAEAASPLAGVTSQVATTLSVVSLGVTE
jgi:hypothetical protein